MAKELLRCWCGRECHGKTGLATHQRQAHKMTPELRGTTLPPDAPQVVLHPACTAAVPKLKYCPCCGVSLQGVMAAIS